MFFKGIDSKIGKTAQALKSSKAKIIIQDRFVLKKLIQRAQDYNIYEGVDLNQQKYVNIYVKQLSAENFFAKQIKQDLRCKIAPATLWSGTHKIQKYIYTIQVHSKYGPSVKQMFQHINQKISQKDFIHLFYEMIKLVQKIGNAGLVCRQLSPSSIVFDENPLKNNLYLLNIFPIKKKNQQCSKLNTKYCSKGCHLGLNANAKDDLESICYILLDIYSQGKFLKNQKIQQYEAVKSFFQPASIVDSLPQIFLDFYHYVMSMNYTDEVNYFHWKNIILKSISKQMINQPFCWMIAQTLENYENKKNGNQIKQIKSDQNIHQNMNEEKQNFNEKISKFMMTTKKNSMKQNIKK